MPFRQYAYELLMRTYAFLFFTFLMCFYSLGQQNALIGKVLDANTNEPLVFATVRIQNTNIGVITDDDGIFRLPYRYKQNKDILEISFIGYETKTFPTTAMNDGEITIIKVTTQIEALGTITLKHKKKTLTAEQIVRKAIANVPRNLPANSNAYIGYYRDYKLIDDEYHNLNEALIEVFDSGIQTDKLRNIYNQSVLYSYSLNDDFKRNAILDNPYDNDDNKFINDAKITAFGGNELTILDIHNPIRNYKAFSFSFIDVLENDFVNNHSFTIEEKTALGKIPIYKISFKGNHSSRDYKYRVQGDLYIQQGNYAIHKMSYNVDQAYVLTSDVVAYSSRGTVQKINLEFIPYYGLKLEYTPIKDKMYLNYISFNNRFRLGVANTFAVLDLIYDIKEQAIFIKFNNDVDFASQPARFVNYSFRFKKEVLEPKEIEFLSKTLVKISFDEDQIPKRLKNPRQLKHLKYELSGIEDVFGNEINVNESFDVYQFREFFVQEVFPRKGLPDDTQYIHKVKNLKKSTVYSTDDVIKTYWLNTPLKKIEGEE